MLLSAGGFAIYRTESHVFSMMAPRFGNLAVRKNREELLAKWLGSKYFRLSGLKADDIRPRVLNECRNAGDFLTIVMDSMARQQNMARWAENTPEHVLYLEEIKRTIPEALIIHIIRDGRDVALSLDRAGWVQTWPWDRKHSLLVAGLYWEWVVEAGKKAGPDFPNDYMEVRFEDLVRDPRGTLGTIGRFIEHDLDYDHIQRVAIGSVREPSTSFASESSGSEFNPVGRWKTLFPQEQLAKFEKLVGPFLETLGYPRAIPQAQSAPSLHLRQLRAMYRAYFSTRYWVKTEVPIAKSLVDIAWMEH